MIVLEKIISGAQTGADLAALEVAVLMGIPTGGWMPRQFRNETGCHPEFARLYGLQATEFDGYPARTEMNVQHSDGTLRFAHNFGTAGERCTMRYIKKWGKPWFDYDFNSAQAFDGTSARGVRLWLADNHIRTLNVAGNSESRAPGMQSRVKYHLIRILSTAECKNPACRWIGYQRLTPTVRYAKCPKCQQDSIIDHPV